MDDIILMYELQALYDWYKRIEYFLFCEMVDGVGPFSIVNFYFQVRFAFEIEQSIVIDDGSKERWMDDICHHVNIIDILMILIMFFG